MKYPILAALVVAILMPLKSNAQDLANCILMNPSVGGQHNFYLANAQTSTSTLAECEAYMALPLAETYDPKKYSTTYSLPASGTLFFNGTYYNVSGSITFYANDYLHDTLTADQLVFTAATTYQILDNECAYEIYNTACPEAGGGLTACLNKPANVSFVSAGCLAGLMHYYVSSGLTVEEVHNDYPNLFPAAAEGLYSSALLAVDVACMPDLIGVNESYNGNDDGAYTPLAGQGLTGFLSYWYQDLVSQSCLTGLEKYFGESQAQLLKSYPNL